MKSEITNLSRISKALQKKYREEIKDIILFGSILRGKTKPKDIDILILFRNKINKDIEYEFKKSLDNNVSLISKTEETIYDSSFSARESMLFEGYSLIRKEFIASKTGFDSLGMFIYYTKNLKNLEKTKFYHALNGRRGSLGVIDTLNAIKLSDNIIVVPLDKIEEAKEFFEQHSIEYKYVPSLLPSRLAKKHIISKVI